MKYTIFIITFILLTASVAAQCTDSDGGKNKYELGTVTEQEEIFSDTCEEENIQEYFCSVEGVASYTLLPCVNGCLDGACQLANEVPKAAAPEEETDSNIKLYFYTFIILLTLGIYIYIFKWKKKKKRY
ncbi:MAG: hypothetical protein Q8R18_06090 [bacterium]|nr:hypothetical protein [bacterium]